MKSFIGKFYTCGLYLCNQNSHNFFSIRRHIKKLTNALHDENDRRRIKEKELEELEKVRIILL